MEILGIYEDEYGVKCYFCGQENKKTVKLKIKRTFKYICKNCICSLWGFIIAHEELENNILKVFQTPLVTYPNPTYNVPGTANPIPYDTPYTGDPPLDKYNTTW